jgi:hypothetical protein
MDNVQKHNNCSFEELSHKSSVMPSSFLDVSSASMALAKTHKGVPSPFIFWLSNRAAFIQLYLEAMQVFTYMTFQFLRKPYSDAIKNLKDIKMTRS